VRNLIRLGAVVVFGAVLNGTPSWAQECISFNGIVVNRKEGCHFAPRGGGGDVPVPLGLNSKVELADGEDYMLSGRIRILPRIAGSRAPRVFFEVDLAAHTWLASKNRKANPRYPIEGSPAEWQAYEGHRVKFSCRATGRVMQVDGRPQYVIFLKGVQHSENQHR